MILLNLEGKRCALVGVCRRKYILGGQTLLYVMGYPDDLKLKASMTLFYEVTGNDVFKRVLDKFYGGQKDQFTVDALRRE